MKWWWYLFNIGTTGSITKHQQAITSNSSSCLHFWPWSFVAEKTSPVWQEQIQHCGAQAIGPVNSTAEAIANRHLQGWYKHLKNRCRSFEKKPFHSNCLMFRGNLSFHDQFQVYSCHAFCAPKKLQVAVSSGTNVQLLGQFTRSL